IRHRLVECQHHRQEGGLQEERRGAEQDRRVSVGQGGLQGGQGDQGRRRHRRQGSGTGHRPHLSRLSGKTARCRIAQKDDGQSQRRRGGFQRLPGQGGRQGINRQRREKGPQGIDQLGAAQGGLGGQQEGRSRRRGGFERAGQAS